MKIRKLLYSSAALLLILIGCTRKEEKVILIVEPEWIDLTYPFDSTTLYWPNNLTGFNHSTDAKGITPGGYFYSSYSICTPEHGGTHLDAPVHFAEGKYTVDELPLSSLTGDAVVIDVSDSALKNRDYLISVSDITNWEKKNGILPLNSIVLFRTGYGKFYPDRENYFGTAKRGLEAIPLLHFPGISVECAHYLIDKKSIKAVGLDTPSMDYGQSKDFPTHRVICGNNRPGFENVAHLDQLPPKGIRVIALPMKIGSGSGAPLRIIASVMKNMPDVANVKEEN
jgi:kynurenine formamidase